MPVAEIGLERFIGTHVRLWPYVHGCYARDLLYRLWALVEQHQAGPRLFWGHTAPPETQADLAHFVNFFDDAKGRVLLIVQSVTKDEIAGFLWFDDFVPQFRAFGSIFMTKAYRGAPAQEAVRLFCDYGFSVLGLHAIWGVTPWPEATRLTAAVGFEPVATLPEFTVIAGRPADVRVVTLTKERFDGITH